MSLFFMLGFVTTDGSSPADGRSPASHPWEVQDGQMFLEVLTYLKREKERSGLKW
jgi:hypothetical protein